MATYLFAASCQRDCSPSWVVPMLAAVTNDLWLHTFLLPVVKGIVVLLGWCRCLLLLPLAVGIVAHSLLGRIFLLPIVEGIVVLLHLAIGVGTHRLERRVLLHLLLLPVVEGVVVLFLLLRR